MTDEFKAYKYYMALKLHFTTEKYDVIKSKGRVKISEDVYRKKRNKLFLYRKAVENFREKETIEFLVANFIAGDKFGGVFSDQSLQIYLDWKKRIESLSYIFEKDLKTLKAECDKRESNFHFIFDISLGRHPLIFRMYLGSKISLETLVLVNKVVRYVEAFDKAMSNDIMWKETSHLIKRYSPFLKYDEGKIRNVYRTIAIRETEDEVVI